MKRTTYDQAINVILKVIVVLIILLGILLTVLCSLLIAGSIEYSNNDATTKQQQHLSETKITTKQPEKKEPNYTEEDVKLLARLIHGEARGECYEGQVAVGAVVLNRVKSKDFPNTLEGVIYQKRQFSCIDDGQFDLPIPENSSVYDAAREALEGKDPTNGCVYFYNPEISTSRWIFENNQ